MKAVNLIKNGLDLISWKGETIAELGDIKARLFHLTPDKEMVLFEEGHATNEWVLVLSGEITVQTPTESITLISGDSLIIPPGTLHRLNVDVSTVGIIIRDMNKDPARQVVGAVVAKTTASKLLADE